jgi:hypothetical protein
VGAADIRHALINALRVVELQHDGEERLLVIGPARDGKLLELVLVPAEDPERVIHADYLRLKFYGYLR